MKLDAFENKPFFSGVVSAERIPLGLYLGFADLQFIGFGLLPLNFRTVYLELKGDESCIDGAPIEN